MGRLIDADKLKEYLQNRLKEAEEKFYYEESKKEARHVTKLLCDDVDAAETVEAIPVKDLTKIAQALKNSREYELRVVGNAIPSIISTWEEEQKNEID